MSTVYSLCHQGQPDTWPGGEKYSGYRRPFTLGPGKIGHMAGEIHIHVSLAGHIIYHRSDQITIIWHDLMKCNNLDIIGAATNNPP